MPEILFNLVAIIVFLLASQWLVKWHRRPLHKVSTKVMIYVAALIMIVVSMTFSISVQNSFIFDMRTISYVIGGLYGGPFVAFLLYVSIIAYRLILGIDVGLLAAAFHYGVLLVVVSIAAKHYITERINRKLLIIMVIMALDLFLAQLSFYWLYASGLPQSTFWQVSFIKLVVTLSIVLLIDIIDRYYKVRFQLDAMEKMELVYHLSASVSHEVRNGITSAHGFLQLLKEGEDDPIKLDYIRISLDELTRTEKIIHDFLTFAKPTTNQKSEVDLGKVIATTIEVIQPLAHMHSIEIKQQLQPFALHGDEVLLQQSFLNFFKNAIEAMPDGGVLEIELQVHRNEGIVTIRDTGVGIDPEKIERLGTPYFTTKGEKGTGLGMMVAFRTIHQLQGEIVVESTVDVGTTWTITLPTTT